MCRALSLSPPLGPFSSWQIQRAALLGSLGRFHSFPGRVWGWSRMGLGGEGGNSIISSSNCLAGSSLESVCLSVSIQRRRKARALPRLSFLSASCCCLAPSKSTPTFSFSLPGCLSVETRRRREENEDAEEICRLSLSLMRALAAYVPCLPCLAWWCKVYEGCLIWCNDGRLALPNPSADISSDASYHIASQGTASCLASLIPSARF